MHRHGHSRHVCFICFMLEDVLAIMNLFFSKTLFIPLLGKINVCSEFYMLWAKLRI